MKRSSGRSPTCGSPTNDDTAFASKANRRRLPGHRARCRGRRRDAGLTSSFDAAHRPPSLRGWAAVVVGTWFGNIFGWAAVAAACGRAGESVQLTIPAGRLLTVFAAAVLAAVFSGRRAPVQVLVEV